MIETDAKINATVTSSTLDAVSKLNIEVRKVVEGLLGGRHLSMHQGASIEFSEYKRYNPGDDIRHIDWKAYARTDRHFIRTHEREVTAGCLLLVDCSASMAYRGSRADYSKLDYAKILAGALAHVLLRQGDAVGLVEFSNNAKLCMSPDRHPESLFSLMKHLTALKCASKGGTDIGEALKFTAGLLGKRSMLLLVTDLLDADKDAEIALAGLSARGHDMSVFQVLSPDELDLPFTRTTTFDDYEDKNVVTVDPALVREDYRRLIAAEEKRWKRATGKAKVDFVKAHTNLPPEVVLAEFAGLRHKSGGNRDL